MGKFLLLTDAMTSGGAERQLSFLAIELKRRGHKVRLVTFYDEPNHYEKELAEIGITAEVRVKGKGRVGRIFQILRLVKEWQPDCAICYKDGSSMAACIARIFKRFSLIVSERNTTQRLSVKERIKFRLCRIATYIVPNSYTQAEFIRTNFPRLMPKVRVITNMLDTDKFTPGSQPHIENEPLRIITTARIAPQKNPLNYLDAVSLLKKRGVNCRFIWFGDTVFPELKQQVLNRISELGLEEIVEFRPATKDVIAEYRKSDIFLLPSDYEGFPNVLCEAMACGLPAIATNVCDSPKILTDSRFLPEAKNPESLAEVIGRMVALSADERREIGARNRQRVITLCSPDKFIEKYEALMQ